MAMRTAKCRLQSDSTHDCLENVASTLYAVLENTTTILLRYKQHVSEDAPVWAHFLFVYLYQPVVGLSRVHEKKVRSLSVHCRWSSAVSRCAIIIRDVGNGRYGGAYRGEESEEG